MNKFDAHKQGFFTLLGHTASGIYSTLNTGGTRRTHCNVNISILLKLYATLEKTDEIILETVFSNTMLNRTLADWRNKLNRFELRNEWKWIA